MVKDGGALARATSIGPRAATGLEVPAGEAGGISRFGITRRGGNNDRLSTLWRDVISLVWRCKVILVGWWIAIFNNPRDVA